MACSSCGSGGGCSTTGEGGGCGKSGGCATGGCNKLNSFDWLSDMVVAEAVFDVVEVRFKGGRKEFFRNSKELELFTGDPIVVEVQNGHHVGNVAMQGELVRLQMRKKNVQNNDEIKQIYRKANQRDVEKWEQSRNREDTTMYRTREIIHTLKLDMKMSDVEYQADNTKATFYYSADDRVDFRELIKLLAAEFKIRVEMKQISLRQEASRLGGIGSCGRELCCSTWLTDFKNVGTSAARYQNLSLNPAKLSGQCSRLKCCLNYELDTYLDALKDIPEFEGALQTGKGDAFLQKTDIFKKVMWFSFRGEEGNWHAVDAKRVTEILAMNKEGKKPVSLFENEEEVKGVDEASIKEKRELSRFDDTFKKKKKKKKKRPAGDRPAGEGAPSQEQRSPSAPQPPREGQREGHQPRPPRQGPRPEGQSGQQPRQNQPQGPRPPRQDQQPRQNQQQGPKPEGQSGQQPRQNQQQGPRPEGQSGQQPRQPRQNQQPGQGGQQRRPDNRNQNRPSGPRPDSNPPSNPGDDNA
jgi:cell fate regulator YaaT (PSP1 superfamily)